MGYPPQGSPGASQSSVDTIDTNVDSILAIAQRGRPSMFFPSVTKAKVIIPGTGADLDFPDVVVAGLPSGITIARVDYALAIGAILDTSTAENQIKTGTTDQIFVKKAATAWSAGSPTVIACLEFEALSLEVGASAYRGGPPLYGAIDIKGVVTVDGTYNFRSEETNETKGVEATGATIELLDVTSIIRVWFN